MFIGAAPASTGGGIKVTTAAVVLATVISVLKGDEEIHLLGHRLKKDAILKTMTVLVLSMAMVMVSFIAVYRCVPQLPMYDVLFEVISGFSTCGSTLNVSAQLDFIGKLVMIFIMFAGRKTYTKSFDAIGACEPFIIFVLASKKPTTTNINNVSTCSIITVIFSFLSLFCWPRTFRRLLPHGGAVCALAP